MDGAIRVQEPGGAWLDLGHRELLAEGGEGRVYVRGEHAYKLYHDPARVLAAGKLRELAVLDHPALIRPRALLLDRRGCPVGYRMARVVDAVALVRLFSGAFQSRQGLDAARLAELCHTMAALVAFVHGHGCLLVDGNELNWLVLSPDYTRVALIDVDSFQTPGYPATAQSPTIRDHRQVGFDEGSDWFALAVLLCHLWVGVHPYKGHHADFARHDLAGRMRAGVSLFDPAVRLPPSARAPDGIPEPWQGWLRAVLTDGERSPAPLGSPRGISQTPVALASPDPAGVVLEPLLRSTSPIHTVLVIDGHRVVITAHEVDVDGVVYPRPAGVGTVLLPAGADQPLWADIAAGKLRLQNLADGRLWPTGFGARRCLSIAGRLYLLAREQLLEIRCRWLGGRWQALVAGAWPVLPEATMAAEGLLWQQVFGQPRLLIPFRPGSLGQLLVPELRPYRLLGGRWEAGVAVLVGARDGRLDRLLLRFDGAHGRYRLDISEDIPSPGWNLAVLETGVAVLGGDTLRVFFSNPARDACRVLEAGPVATLTLVAEGTRLLGYRGRELYRLRLDA